MNASSLRGLMIPISNNDVKTVSTQRRRPTPCLYTPNGSPPRHPPAAAATPAFATPSRAGEPSRESSSQQYVHARLKQNRHTGDPTELRPTIRTSTPACINQLRDTKVPEKQRSLAKEGKIGVVVLTSSRW